MARQTIELERLYVRKRLTGTKPRDVWNCRMSAQIEEHAVALQGAHAAVSQSHLNGARSDESPFAKHQFGAAFLVLIHVHADEPVDHLPLASPDLGNVDRRWRGAAAKIPVMTDKVGHLRAV